MYYALTLNGKLVGITKENPYQFNLSGVSIHEFDEEIPDLNTSVWDEVTETLVTQQTILTKLQFQSRFTIEERIAIRISTNPVVVDIMAMLDSAEFIDITNQTTINGVSYLASVGLLTQQRVAEILG